MWYLHQEYTEHKPTCEQRKLDRPILEFQVQLFPMEQKKLD